MMSQKLVENDLLKRVERIKNKIDAYIRQGQKVFVTSSFQTQSVPLLHIISHFKQHVAVYFIDTGYLFPETYLFRDQLIELLDINVISLKSDVPKNYQMDGASRALYVTNPDRCCYLNKILPLESVLKEYDIWVSGVLASQSAVRGKFSEEENGKHGILRYHPLLQWTQKEIHYYSKYYHLPEHPLQSQGYMSIGCLPCTSTLLDESKAVRAGRWAGMKKEECGLHTELITTEEK